MKKPLIYLLSILVMCVFAFSFSKNIQVKAENSICAGGEETFAGLTCDPVTEPDNEQAVEPDEDTGLISFNKDLISKAKTEPVLTVKDYLMYHQIIQKTVSMTYNSNAQALANKYGLNILNVTWEDTGRYKGSCVGPNISDMTIQIQEQDPKTKQYNLSCMPVIRYPNYSDKSADIDPEKFYLFVGNEKGKALSKITLKQFLTNPKKYMSNPDSWTGKENSLFAKRDTHVLVSAQACFLPVPKKGMAQFNPVLFNYQSYQGDPAVLTILATREGTSMTIIDNKRDAFNAGMTWGQRLFFNKNSERASLTGKRLSDFVAEKNGKTGNLTIDKAEKSGLNLVLLIQVPLKQKEFMRPKAGNNSVMYCLSESASCDKKAKSNVEQAVIGHGKVEGPFTEVDGLDIKRDERYPIRVTVQFYKATDNGIVSEQDMKEISEQINKVYSHADYVGSLVTGGETGRSTEYTGSKDEPAGWWNAFWERHEKNTGKSREETIKMLRKLFGPGWEPRSIQELKNDVKELENN